MSVTTRQLFRSSLFALAAIAGLGLSGREAQAQVTYVGTFALANGATDRFLTGPNYAPFNSTELGMYSWAALPAQQWALYRLPNGFYAIMNLKSGEFLEDPSYSAANVPMDQNPWTGGLHQQWFLCQMSGNFYALVNAASGKTLTDPNAINPRNGMDVAVQEGWYGGLAQWWYLAFLRY